MKFTYYLFCLVLFRLMKIVFGLDLNFLTKIKNLFFISFFFLQMDDWAQTYHPYEQ